MKPKYYLQQDDNLRCRWVLVRGHIDDSPDAKGNRYLRNSVIERGPDRTRGEVSATQEVSSGHTYLLAPAMCSWTCLARYGAC